MILGMRITVIGTGFVGVVTAAVLASFQNEVIGLDIDEKKIAKLREGKVPFFEPGLEELLASTQAGGKLSFTTSYADAVREAEIVLVAVGTPSAPDGTADLTYVEKAVESAAAYLKPKAIVCIKSTVPPGTLAQLRPIIAAKTTVPFVLASLPEFLREGSAVADTLRPDRVVVGCSDPEAREKLREMHAPFQAPIIMVSPESAQMGKYSANSYLAMRITFINQIADLCEENGADVQEVIRVIGEDKRIGKHYWYPGLGYGGSCFPKDVRELAAYSRTIGHGNNLFNKIHELNSERIYEKLDEFEALVGGWEGKSVALLGLSFKPNTDDLREAPSTKIIPHLLHKGAKVLAHDPLAVGAAKQVFGSPDGLTFVDDIQDAVGQAEALLVVVEWPAYLEYPFDKVPGKGRLFVDARNQFSPDKLEAAGWRYVGIGRSSQRRAK